MTSQKLEIIFTDKIHLKDNQKDIQMLANRFILALSITKSWSKPATMSLFMQMPYFRKQNQSI